MNRLRIIILTCALLCLAGCKEAAITFPEAYNESDFNVPPATYSSATASLFVNRAAGVVYVGEEFEIKVALYHIPETLFAASLDVTVPSNVHIERIVRNPAYIGSGTSTISVEYVTGQSASFGVSYRRLTTPHVDSTGVLLKLICKAVAVGDSIMFTPANADFRITRKNVALSPTSQNSALTLNLVGVAVKVSDEFSHP